MTLNEIRAMYRRAEVLQGLAKGITILCEKAQREHRWSEVVAFQQDSAEIYSLARKAYRTATFARARFKLELMGALSSAQITR